LAQVEVEVVSHLQVCVWRPPMAPPSSIVLFQDTEIATAAPRSAGSPGSGSDSLASVTDHGSPGSGSDSLASVTDHGALMLPEPDVPESNPAKVPALPLAAESLAARALQRSKEEAGLAMDAMDVEHVLARLTPRGSLIAVQGQAMSAAAPPLKQLALQTRGEPWPAPPKVALASLKSINPHADSQHLQVRAETAEHEVRKLRMENNKLEGEVRKLRSDAYFARIGKNLKGPHSHVDKSQGIDELSTANDPSADVQASRLQSEQRAVQAEGEVLRLHTELQAARIQFAIIADGASTTVPDFSPDVRQADELPESACVLCFKRVWHCFQRCLMRCLLVLCCICCCRKSPQKERPMAEAKKGTIAEGAVNNFCIVDRA